MNNNNAGAGGAVAAIIGLFFLLIELAVIAVVIAGMWKVYAKAGKPGWAAIVPIYNIIVLWRSSANLSGGSFCF